MYCYISSTVAGETPTRRPALSATARAIAAPSNWGLGHHRPARQGRHRRHRSAVRKHAHREGGTAERAGRQDRTPRTFSPGCVRRATARGDTVGQHCIRCGCFSCKLETPVFKKSLACLSLCFRLFPPPWATGFAFGQALKVLLLIRSLTTLEHSTDKNVKKNYLLLQVLACNDMKV